MSKILVTAQKIYSLDKEDEFFTAMVIEDGRILEMGLKETYNLTSSSYDEIYDYSNQIIIPGFNDSHIHMLSYGEFLTKINLVGTTKQEFLDRIKKKVDSEHNSDWIIGRGWDHENFESSSYPTKHDLDSISKDHPIILHRICGHICVVNSKALEISHITSNTIAPDGGIIDIDPITGDTTGILRETAIDLVKDCIPETEQSIKLSYLRQAISDFNKKGITSVQTNDKNAYFLYKTIKDSNELTVRIYLTPMIDELPTLQKIGAKTNQGDNFLRWGRMKFFSDGSLGGETAALINNYINSSSNGILKYTEKKLVELMTQAHKNEWQLEIHAIGDRSAQLIVKLFESTSAFKNRAVLTHCQILNKDLIDKMAQLGIIANIQPIFLNTDLHWVEKKIGSNRMKYSYAWNTLRKANIVCAGGSDAPVESPDPILGIHAAVNRQDITGYPKEGWYMDEALTVWDAVRLFTVNSAYAEFQESQKGKLLANYLADFIVLDKDIFTVPKESIREIKIVSTFVHGKRVYNANN